MKPILLILLCISCLHSYETYDNDDKLYVEDDLHTYPHLTPSLAIEESPTTEPSLFQHDQTTEYISSSIESSTIEAIHLNGSTYFSYDLVIVWEKCGKIARTRSTRIFSANLENYKSFITLWYFPSLNSLVFHIEVTDKYEIINIKSVDFETLFIMFDESGQILFYTDCPSLNKNMLVWNSQLVNQIYSIDLYENSNSFSSLEDSLEANSCRTVLLVKPGSVLCYNVSSDISSGILLLSFMQKSIKYSINLFDDSIRIMNSDVQNPTIYVFNLNKKNQEIVLFILFEENSVKIFVECPYKAIPIGQWNTTFFSEKRMVESSLLKNKGIALSDRMMERFCRLNDFVKKVIMDEQASYFMNMIKDDFSSIKFDELESVFLPNRIEYKKIEYFYQLYKLNGHLLGQFIDVTTRILIASRSYAPRGFFDRSIIEYENGFSDNDKNFWIGLDVLNKLTTKNHFKIRVEINQADTLIFEEYSEFQVADRNNGYQLSVSGLIKGSDGYFAKRNGLKFSTYDFGDFQQEARSILGGYWFDNRDSHNGYYNYYLYCFTCSSEFDKDGTYHNNYLSHSQFKTYVTRIYLIP